MFRVCIARASPPQVAGVYANVSQVECVQVVHVLNVSNYSRFFPNASNASNVSISTECVRQSLVASVRVSLTTRLEGALRLELNATVESGDEPAWLVHTLESALLGNFSGRTLSCRPASCPGCHLWP